jgi:hypothetical protein
LELFGTRQTQRIVELEDLKNILMDEKPINSGGTIIEGEN